MVIFWSNRNRNEHVRKWCFSTLICWESRFHALIAFLGLWVAVVVIACHLPPIISSELGGDDGGGTPHERLRPMFASMKAAFPQASESVEESIVMYCDTCDMTRDRVPRARVSDVVSEFEDEFDRLAIKYPGALRDWAWFYRRKDWEPPSKYIAADNRTMRVTYRVSQSTDHGFFEALHSMALSLSQDEPSCGGCVRVAARGSKTSAADLGRKMIIDVFCHEIFVGPIIVLVLWFALGRGFRCITPLLCQVFSVTCAAAGVVVCRCYLLPDLFVPIYWLPLVSFLCLALALDYGLFWWSRFASERQAGASVDEAIARTQLSSGGVCLTSSLVLVLCYAGQLFYPYANEQSFSSLAVGLIFGIGGVVLASLVLPPVLALTLPSLFDELVTKDATTRREESCEKQSSWFWPMWAQLVTGRHAVYLLPCAMYVLMAPLALYAADFRPNYDMENLLMDRVGSDRVVQQRCQEAFPDSSFSPTYLLMELTHEETMEEPSDANTFVQISMRGQVPNGSELDSGSFVQGLRADASHGGASGRLERAQLLLHHASVALSQLVDATSNTSYALQRSDIKSIAMPGSLGWKSTPSSLDLQSVLAAGPPLDLFDELVSGDGLATLAVLMPKYDPFGVESQALAADLLSRIASNLSTTVVHGRERYKFRVQSGSKLANLMLMSTDLRAASPKIFSVVFAVMFAAVALVFRAAAVPLKLFLTVVMPTFCVWGVVIAVYQKGVLSWTGFESVSAFGGVWYTTPYMFGPFLVGLAMDYDIFLFAAVWDLRHAGLSNKKAVQVGLEQTGPVISAAGFLMAAAFAGLLVMRNEMVNQIGLVVVLGTLFDTFVVRTCLVPSMLCLVPVANYWPTVMPASEDEIK